MSDDRVGAEHVTLEWDQRGGVTVHMDGSPQSHVQPDDPTLLVFAYIRTIASVTDAAYPPGEALRAYHLGGGGLTLPRYLADVRPGTHNLVSEIDPGVVDLDDAPEGA